MIEHEENSDCFCSVQRLDEVVYPSVFFPDTYSETVVAQDISNQHPDCNFCIGKFQAILRNNSVALRVIPEGLRHKGFRLAKSRSVV